MIETKNKAKAYLIVSKTKRINLKKIWKNQSQNLTQRIEKDKNHKVKKQKNKKQGHLLACMWY